MLAKKVAPTLFLLSITWFAVTGTCFTLAAGDDPPQKKAAQFDQAEREAIVAAATLALNKHVRGERKKESPDEIDPAHWGEAITKLKPLRVRNDRINIAIVLAVNAGVEEGLYISNPISSYAAGVGDRFQVLVLTAFVIQHDPPVERLDLGPMGGPDVAGALEAQNRIPAGVEVGCCCLNGQQEPCRVVDGAEYGEGDRLDRSLAEIDQPERFPNWPAVLFG